MKGYCLNCGAHINFNWITECPKCGTQWEIILKRTSGWKRLGVNIWGKSEMHKLEDFKEK